MKADKSTFWDVFNQLGSEDKFAKWPFSNTLVNTRTFTPAYPYNRPGITIEVYTSATKSAPLGSHSWPPVVGSGPDTGAFLGGDELQIPSNAPVVARMYPTGSILFCMSFEGTDDMTFTGSDGKSYKGAWITDYSDDYYRAAPNTFGPPPSIQDLQVIPPTSPRVCVGWGNITLKGFQTGWVLHDQYWAAQSSSYSLLPRQMRKTLVELVSGLQDTTSDAETISASLGISVSGGWGAVSAAINASLAAESQHQHTVELMQQTRTMSEDKVVSASDSPAAVVYWGLVDSYTLVGCTDTTSQVVATIETVQAPPIVRIYPPDAKFAPLSGKSSGKIT